MVEKTMAEILAAAKKAKAAIDGDQYAGEGEYFDPSNLTLEQKLKLRKAANNPTDPNYHIWLQMNQEKQTSGWVKIDKKKIKNFSEDDEENND
ncbi:hypothetical protein [Spiroplasma endosymbiont of Phyllotreta cruciferae]|uniref:hypothetical protein n=1 Tax=Spiroplasma endosymbiont of Phyllotreta cruciferae TaxID=2886375 RepID=UPI00209E947D|nr:hypothetical protein [Spiroplasma endosymbiont of Phyllotreta cruciferae]